MKKSIILSIATVFAFVAVSFGASAENVDKPGNSAESSASAESTLSASSSEVSSPVMAMTLNEFVYLYEQSLFRKGYTITKFSSNQIEAVKTRPSLREAAKILSSDNKKVKTQTLTATFSKDGENFGVQVEKGTKKQTLDEWKAMVGESFKNEVDSFKGNGFRMSG